MKHKRKLIGAWIVFHFVVMVIAMWNPKLEFWKPFWKGVSWYGKVTGASASYSFFSPDIPREVVFQFTVHNRDHTSFQTTLQESANNEVNARVGNILRTIPRSFKKKKIVRSLAASVTASMFELYPDAEKIEMRGLIYILPSMDEYRKGERAQLKQIYAATFAKNAAETETHEARN